MERERHPVRAAPPERHPERVAPLEPHPVRAALLELIRRDGVVTATGAARELGGSTGLYSFHLRQLARHGVLEEAPAPGGRVRPWRLARPGTAGPSGEQPGEQPGERQPRPVSDAELSAVARGLEDESYRRWLEHRVAAPGAWRRDEAFSQVLYLTPDEMAGMAEVIRALIAQYRHREARPAARPPEAAPVAVVARLFPLLEPRLGSGGWVTRASCCWPSGPARGNGWPRWSGSSRSSRTPRARAGPTTSTTRRARRWPSSGSTRPRSSIRRGSRWRLSTRRWAGWRRAATGCANGAGSPSGMTGWLPARPRGPVSAVLSYSARSANAVRVLAAQPAGSRAPTTAMASPARASRTTSHGWYTLSTEGGTSVCAACPMTGST